MNSIEGPNTNEKTQTQNTLPPPVTPDLNAPIFFIEDKSGQDNEIKNARKKLTGDMDLISHFGLYYLYEISKNKTVDNDSDYQSYIEDIPMKQIIKDTTIRDLIMQQQTQKISILPFDQDTLINAFTLKPGEFPEEPSLDTSFFKNKKQQQNLNENVNKIPKVKINVTHNEYEKPKVEG